MIVVKKKRLRATHPAGRPKEEMHHLRKPEVGNTRWKVEIKATKDRMDLMMNVMKGWTATLNDLVHRTDSPFIAQVTSCLLPPKFRMPSLETYDGTKDPLDHLESFKTLMHLQGNPNEIMCWAFPTTMKEPVQVWFNLDKANTFVHLYQRGVQLTIFCIIT